MRKNSRNTSKAQWCAATLVAACASLTLTVCAVYEQTQTPQPLQLGRPEVNGWFACTECTSGELQAVVALRNEAVRDLALVFDSSAVERFLGPYRQHLREQWRRQVEYAKTDPEAAFEGSETEYVTTYAANLSVSYQSRAVRALSEIGTPEALKAIADARSRVTDPRVISEIDKALKRDRSPRARK